MKRFGTILLLAGSALLIWTLTVWVSGALFNWYEVRKLERHVAFAPEGSLSLRSSPSSQVAPPNHSLIGRLAIPRLHVSTIVLEGDDDHVLRLGSGHIPESSLPEEIGNVGIAAHRDTFFRPLRKIAVGDRISFTTPHGSYEYEVQSTEIVHPDDIDVLKNSNRPELTLVTCYPFYYLGPAPMRFIVHARRLDALARRVDGQK